MLVILSGAYVDSELVAEFGKVPPAFLPVGNRRLYAHQLARHGGAGPVYLTVPGGFALDEGDQRDLAQRAVRLYRSGAGLPLGAALHDFLADMDVRGRLDVLYGDTLITDAPPEGSDWLAVGRTDTHYNWREEAPRRGQPGGVWSGMFSFSDARLLRQRLRELGDFIAAVDDYGGRVGGLRHHAVTRWLDFGHVHTFFDSRRQITTERHFNHLEVGDGVVAKSSDDGDKMRAEAAWFEQAPMPVKPFLAPYMGRIEGPPCGYAVEYLHLATLSELFVFGRLPEPVWRRIFAACDHYLRRAGDLPPGPPLAAEHARHLYLDKTLRRLDDYAAQRGCDLDAGWRLNGRAAPSLRAMATEAAAALMAAPATPSFIHGDLCFSNILFDFRAGSIKLIDPRGTDADGRPSAHGDRRYEIGKLAHSVLGLYDHIMAGYFELAVDGQALRLRLLAEHSAPLQRLFLATPFAGRLPVAWDCRPLMVVLFLSMLPLHADNALRQQALMANGIRLYLEWREHDHPADGGAQPPLL
jgi:hypothetical protein